MSFEVRMKKRTKMIVLRIFSALMAVVMIWFINLDFIRPALMQDGAYLLFIGFIGIFLMFFVWSFYAQKRPRIKVDGQDITFYPMWRPSQKVTLSAITARNVKGDATGEKIDAAIGGALLSPPLADALEQRYTAALQNPNPKDMVYTYYSGDTKLISVSTKNMENVERFDRMVADRLEGKPLEQEMPAAEIQPAKKSKFPLALAGLIGVICVVAAIMLAPRKASQSPDLLAGTSWISGNDNSQWVFGTDKTFHWYQTEGETDDNYFAGTYEFHVGQDAINYLTTEFSDYGITERKIRQVLSSNSEYMLDNFVCFSCVNQSFMLRGKEQLSEDTISSYLGFFLQDGTYLDIANMTTGTYYGFTKE
ncbi:hypothetical protein [Sporofaciens musculi]|uniref:hypothetical protein n=1 Tax=Sporofaciens musculi TaxID=2681861 RepID=UPI0025880FC0|nr:hypothetical protein [Sporofaciens musculi]